MITQAKTTWRKAKLGDIADLNMGQSPRSEFYNDRGEGLPFFQGVTDFGERKPEETMYCSKPTKIVKRGDVLISVRAPVGDVNIAEKESCIGRGVAGISAKDKNNEFLYYLLLNFKDYIRSYSGGTTYESINKDALRDLEFLVPESSVARQQIADILSTYDDLIENNTKRIKILEEITQAIYREWFVYFRFLGHDKVKMVDSKTEFGKIPVGWRIGKLSDLATVTMGQSPSSDFYNESKEGVPFHQGVTNFGFRFPTTITYSTEGTRRAGAGDILCSVRAPVGRINVADRDMIIGRGLASMKSISGHQSFLLYHLKHLFQTEDLIGSGAIFASVTKDDLNNFSSLVPDASIIEEFERLVRSIDEIIFNITSRLSILKKGRDLLLPKLVTGEIRV